MRAVAAGPTPSERVAVIDLGPAPLAEAARAELDAAIVGAGLQPATGDGVDAALAGVDVARDAAQLAAAMATAQRAFGALSCSEVAPAAQQAIGIAAARQAAGLPVPELARAFTYLLLCADREGQIDTAHAAAQQLRTLGATGSAQVPAALWTKYPAIDVVANRTLVPLDITTDAAGAAIWIDFRPAGVAPLHVVLPAGAHVIAAASGSRRGWAAGTAIAKQKSLHVPLADATGPWGELAQRVASWRGQRPDPDEIAWVLTRVPARLALVRSGDTIEAWARAGAAEAPRSVGAAAPIDEAPRVLGRVVAEVRAWTDRAPDPDQPLLVETGETRRARTDEAERPTKWWVYAAIAGAAVLAGGALYLHDNATDRQRVELRYP